MTQTAVSNTALSTLVSEFLGPMADAAQDEASALLSSGELRKQEGMNQEWTATVWPPGGQGIVIADNGRLPNGVASIEGLARQMPNAIVHVLSPSLDVYSCPLAMTDGAARTLLASGNRCLLYTSDAADE